jgi:hypothetical protein
MLEEPLRPERYFNRGIVERIYATIVWGACADSNNVGGCWLLVMEWYVDMTAAVFIRQPQQPI